MQSYSLHSPTAMATASGWLTHFSSFMAILRGSVSPSSSTITGAHMLQWDGTSSGGRLEEEGSAAYVTSPYLQCPRPQHSCLLVLGHVGGRDALAACS